jgi:hypothetical protein
MHVGVELLGGGGHSETKSGRPRRGAALERQKEALRWNGTKWSSFKTPEPGGTGMGDLSTLNGVRCTTAANCWAVGESQESGGIERQEILHWKGKKWFVG